MKINSSLIFTAIAIIGIFFWFLFNSKGNEIPPNAPLSTAAKETPLPHVVVQTINANPHEKYYTLYGRTQASREVSVKAVTAGSIVATPTPKGRRVATGDLLCRQGIDSRQANLAQAQAMLKAAEVEFNSNKILVDKGFQSSIILETQKAAIDSARAAVSQAEIELDNVNIRAPFSGILDTQTAQVGDYLSTGQACASIIQLSPLHVIINLTEAQLGKVSLGQSAQIELATGQIVTGKIKFIEAKAQEATRTFMTELSVPNSDYAIKGGLTATVRLSAGQSQAHLIPSKILALNAEGALGVRYIDIGNRVVFAPVEKIDEDPSGIWVTGLPERVSIIIEGQDFVADGVEVNPTRAAYSPDTR